MMMMRSYNTLLIFCLMPLLSSAAPFDVSQCHKTTTRGDGLVCYRGHQTSYNFTNAQTFCQQQGGKLATLTSEAEDAAVVEILKENFLDSVWIGMKQELGPWSWSDGKPLTEQGCHHRDHITTFTATTTLSSNTPSNCLTHCSQQGFAFAALSAATECSCGSTFQTSTHTTAQCNTPCPSQTSQNCGGDKSYRVLAVNGSYSSWMKGRPSNGASNNNLHSCAIMLIDPTPSPTNSPTWLDLSCNNKFKTICQIELNADFSTCDMSIEGIHSLTYTHTNTQTNMCLYINHTPMDYFSATQMCGRLNGRIVDVGEGEVNGGMAKLLGGNVVQEFWIGAQKFKQEWNDATPVIFSKWQSLSYKQPLSCGSVQSPTTATTSYNWKLLQCDLDLNVVCETSNSTHLNKATFFRSTLAPTTPRPVTKLTNPLPSTTLPTINITIPSPSDSNLVKYATLGGVLGGVLLLVLVAVVVVAVIIKKKHQLPAARTDLEAKKSVFVEPTYFFGATTQKETGGVDSSSCGDSGNDCGSSSGGGGD